MAKYNELNKRMKELFEEPAKTKLMYKVPVAIRVDGRAFHTFTRGFKRPFDKILRETMMETMKALCENIQGCTFAYEQSDEITLILTDYETETTSAWFDYEVQKMCSIAASMATMYFNKIFTAKVNDLKENETEDIKYINTMVAAAVTGAMFDARCFNIPREEVYNLILARQIDASKNSVASVGQANFSVADLRGKSTNKVQDMLMLYKGINWNDFPTENKRGAACYRVEKRIEASNAPNGFVMRKKWVIDTDMPILKNSDKKEDRNYIERFVY